jgi:hypothetical protein
MTTIPPVWFKSTLLNSSWWTRLIRSRRWSFPNFKAIGAFAESAVANRTRVIQDAFCPRRPNEQQPEAAKLPHPR